MEYEFFPFFPFGVHYIKKAPNLIGARGIEYRLGVQGCCWSPPEQLL